MTASWNNQSLIRATGDKSRLLGHVCSLRQQTGGSDRECLVKLLLVTKHQIPLVNLSKQVRKRIPQSRELFWRMGRARESAMRDDQGESGTGDQKDRMGENAKWERQRRGAAWNENLDATTAKRARVKEKRRRSLRRRVQHFTAANVWASLFTLTVIFLFCQLLARQIDAHRLLSFSTTNQLNFTVQIAVTN